MNKLLSDPIKKDIQVFESSVKKLSSNISKSSSLWNDKKFSSLSASVSEIAILSKDVIVSAERCCTSIDRFEKIASEKI